MNIVAQRQLSAAKWVKSTAANLGSRAGLAHCKWVSLAPSGAGYSGNSTSPHLGISAVPAVERWANRQPPSATHGSVAS